MDCVRDGYDVFTVNGCPGFNETFDYSSVVLLGSYTSLTALFTNQAGTILILLFAAAVFLLPQSRSIEEALSLTLTLFSNSVFFALYQGNIDILIFIIFLVAGRLLLCSARLRAVGYGMILFAGSLKFYPVAVMMIAMRERIPAFLLVLAVSLLGLGGFVYYFGHDAERVMGLIPNGKITQMFGANVIGRGIEEFPFGIRTSNNAPPYSTLGFAVQAALTLSTALAAAQCARSVSFCDAVRRLPVAHQLYLAIGCILILACFFSGSSYRYRGVFLLLVIPALSLLAATSESAKLRLACRLAVLTTIGLLWSVQIGNGLDHGLIFSNQVTADFLFAVYWLARELAWWCLIAFMAGSLASLMMDYAMIKQKIRALSH